ncbi:carbohydrate ABC transporter permease [Pseudonocardia nigra]|uniref:carbohydrate ABC transporter permease n=1 Tax=Pseudonocardia nigra TaxID=1921578 RepID=UPI001C5D738A|nr:sugar ABC transporter permease [Pseudonocardia nigra]
MRYGKYRFIASFLVVPLALYVVFVVSPYLQAFYISMTDWSGFSGSQNFIGLGNYVELATDARFWRAMSHNALMLVVVPLVTIALALFLATMTTLAGRHGVIGHGGVRGSRFYQVVYFFPHVVPVVIAGVLFAFFYNPQAGLLNSVLRLVGFEWLTRPWLGDTTFALPAVMAVLIWGAVGFYYVLFSAAMKSVPSDVFEAATLDGAGRMRTFWSITLPMIWDSVQVSYIYLGIMVLDAFALLQVMLPEGGPDGSTEVVAQYLYRAAFTEGRFGYASAIGVALCFVTLLLAVAVLRLSRREQVEY